MLPGLHRRMPVCRVFIAIWFWYNDLSGKPGNVREFHSCRGNVRDFTNSGKCQGGNLVGEKLPKTVYCKLHICIQSIQVFSRSLFCVKY